MTGCRPARCVVAGSSIRTGDRSPTGMMVSCIEEIAYRRGFLTLDELDDLVGSMGDNHYKRYLQRMIINIRRQ